MRASCGHLAITSFLFSFRIRSCCVNGLIASHRIDRVKLSSPTTNSSSRGNSLTSTLSHADPIHPPTINRRNRSNPTASNTFSFSHARHHHIFPPSRQLPRGTHDRSLSYGTARRNLFETVENLPGFWILKRHCVRGSGESRGTHIIGDEGKNAGVENLVGQRMGQGEPLGDEVAEMDPQGEQSQSDPGGIWRGIGRLAEELEEVVENLRETAGKEVRKWRDPSVGRRSEFPRRRGSWREGRGGPGRSGRRVRLRRR